MLLLPSITSPAALRPIAGAAFAALRRFGSWCAHSHARAEQRRHLAELDERMLKDVGITPSEAAKESAKPWWQA
jgi:uncharacterized protein YjiS (DUF1127 family)